MQLKFVLITLTISLVYSDISTNEVSFKNNRIVGSLINNSEFKFNKTVTTSNSLKESLPEDEFDKLELLENITILYKDSISDIDNLKELIINSNGLQEIQPGAFKNVPKLIELDISHNQLKQIKDGVFNSLSIELLYLSYNEIEIIDEGAFNNMPSLITIKLDNNRIKQWNSNWFENTPKLCNLFVTHNELVELPAEAFKNLKYEPTLRPLLGLWFSYNKIQRINDDAFKHLTYIEILDLEMNELHNFNENWLNGINVTTLDISSNLMNCLRGDFDQIFSAKLTKIDENPWSCDCLENITNYMAAHPGRIDIVIRERTCKI